MRFSGGLDLSGENRDWIVLAAPRLGSIGHSGCNWFANYSCASDITQCPECRREDSILIIGNIRLYEARDLARRLSISVSESFPNDPTLVLAAYRKWGQACPAYLSGEFAFAILDNSRNEVFLAVDHFATIPICYWREGSKFAFANDPGLLLRIPGVPRQLNRRKLAASLLSVKAASHNEETLHAGVISLSPGTSLTIGPARSDLNTYWVPQVLDGLIPKREDDVFEAVRELLFASVRNRLNNRTSIAAMLSGGLDSSSIVAIAADCLKSENRELLALSSVSAPSSAGRLRDEREFIEEFRQWPNVRIELIDAPGRGPFDRLEALSRYENAPDQSSRQFLYEEIDGAAVASGADIMLDGCFGEISATSWGRGYYLELAARSRWWTLISELNSRNPAGAPARSRKRAIRAFASECAAALSPSNPKHPLPMLLAEGFRCESATGASAQRIMSQPQLQREAVHSAMRRHANRTGSPSLTGVQRTFPMLDKRLLEFCIAAPGRMKVQGGYPRYLVRRALDGILPRKLQWRTSKTPFSPDYFVRYNAQLGMARKFVAAIGPKDPVRAIVDVSRLSLLLDPVHPVQGSFDALATIPSTIYLICFLRQFAEFR